MTTVQDRSCFCLYSSFILHPSSFLKWGSSSSRSLDSEGLREVAGQTQTRQALHILPDQAAHQEDRHARHPLAERRQ